MTPEKIKAAVEALGYTGSFVDLMEWFAYDHIADPFIRGFSKQCYDLAMNMCNDLTDNEELYLGLQDLLKAKDSFVRSAIRSRKGDPA